MYRVKICVKRVEGECAAGYKIGDQFYVNGFYIEEQQNVKICLHALSSMLTLLTPFLKGVPAKILGIGTSESIGYVQCPDPGKPYTDGGTVTFELVRES